MAQPDPVTIEEIDVADPRTVTLDGPDLPFARPRDLAGFDAGGPVEHQEIYLPGRSEPIYQVMQARYRPMQLQGAFRDHLAIRDGRPNAGDGYARAQVQALEEIRHRANPVRVSWGSYSVRGLLVEARFGFESNSQITYSLEFKVAAVEDSSEVSPAVTTAPIDDGGSSIAASMRTLLAARAAELAPTLALMRARDQVIAVENALDLVDSGLQALTDASTSFLAARPADILTAAARVAGAGRIAQIQTDTLRLAMVPLDAAARQNTSSAARLRYWLARLGMEDVCLQIIDQCRSASAAARARVRSAERVYVVADGDTLESIARAQLGDASRAGELGVRASDLRPGLLVRIPARR
jgi:hypothetical protein